MSEYRKQHYIAQSYLTPWCDPTCPPNHDSYVWIFEKDQRTGKKKAPKNIFHENNMYTIVGKSGERDVSIEKSLSGIESDYSAIRQKKISRLKKVDELERLIICAFIAAMRVRTPRNREHIRSQWGHALKMGEDLKRKMEAMSQKERDEVAKTRVISAPVKKVASLSLEDVRKMVNEPLQITLLPVIVRQAPLLFTLDFSVHCAPTGMEFITSDDPCIWFDPQLIGGNPNWNVPTLGSNTIEVILPVSPNQCILLNKKGVTGYLDASPQMVTGINRLLRLNADKKFVNSKNTVREEWF